MFIISSYLLISIWLAVCVSIHSFEPPIGSDFYPERFHNKEHQDYNVNKFHDEFNEFDDTTNEVFYWLYTNDVPNGQLLNRNESRMIESTTYDLRNPMKLIVHGWLGNTGYNGLCSINIKSYFKVGNYNVICVDWKKYSTDMSYVVAKARAKYIGKDIANVLSRITNNMTEGIKDMHLIGHSMGAHIVGFAGKILTNLVPRITGLDPARPLYEKSSQEDRLHVTDAHFVDIIHTNGDKNGFNTPLGHIDFYPNGGKSQPNCGVIDKWTGACSHAKSYQYFAHSIWAKEDYFAQNCFSFNVYKENKCNNDDYTFMGEHVAKNKKGNYYLEIYDEGQYRR